MIGRVDENFVVHCCFRRVIFFGKTYGMERSISISELSAENGVAVVNAYELIYIGDNEDHIDDDSTNYGGLLIFVRHHSGPSVWNSKS